MHSEEPKMDSIDKVDDVIPGQVIDFDTVKSSRNLAGSLDVLRLSVTPI